MKKIETENLDILSWADEVEAGALKQAKNLANLPFAKRHIALMPDVHQGYGMPIGGVLATRDALIPNAVGVDIGCGMCAVKTSLTDIDAETLRKIIGEIKRVVPVGFNKHKKEQDESLMPNQNYTELDIVYKEYFNALKSLGTLGGGNHFIEIQKGSDGYIWIMIHSGSRNLGKQIADHYNKIAIDLNKKCDRLVPKEWELAFLSVNSKEGQNYIREMNYAVDFALANRSVMMKRVKDIFKNSFNKIQIEGEMINIAHNYASLENHFGENLWIHRKGATLASKDTVGIIPGSQGTPSYIVKGKGSIASFKSCSHGAGRKMGRKQAERELNYEEEIKKMGNVLHGMKGKKDLDEAPGSYKDIDDVMKRQEDLVEVLVELKPLAVIKG